MIGHETRTRQPLNRKETSYDDKQDRKRTWRSDRRGRIGETAKHRTHQAEGLWKGPPGGNTETGHYVGRSYGGVTEETHMVVVVDGEEMKNWLSDRFIDICVIAGIVVIVWQLMLGMLR